MGYPGLTTFQHQDKIKGRRIMAHYLEGLKDKCTPKDCIICKMAKQNKNPLYEHIHREGITKNKEVKHGL
jgi:biotin synthase-like enzyme